MLSERGLNSDQWPSVLPAINIGLNSTGLNPPLKMTSLGSRTTANLAFIDGDGTFHELAWSQEKRDKLMAPLRLAISEHTERRETKKPLEAKRRTKGQS